VYTALRSTGALYFAVFGLKFDIEGSLNMRTTNQKILKKWTPHYDYKLHRITECP
jgi:hypothetical protein